MAKECPLYVKIGIGVWIFVVFNIIALGIYLHYSPFHSSHNRSTNITENVEQEEVNSISNTIESKLRSFYLAVNQQNTYLDPNNINNEIIVSQLLKRLLLTNSNENNDQNLVIINSIAQKFEFHLKPICKSEDRDKNTNFGCFMIIQKSNTQAIQIFGSNIPSIISGLSLYLSKYWMVSTSWNGNNINSLLNPEYLSKVIDSTPSNINIYASRKYEYTYYKNPCTDSYTMVWWDWDRWEMELDWMVLNNINLLLLPTINELIEYQLYTTVPEYRLTDEELSTYFVGPAFLAWFRMGNLRGWPPNKRNDGVRAVGLSQTWLKKQLILSYKIMARCIELGIDIILPGFSGHVPTKFADKIKGAQFYDGSRWFGMPHELTNLKFLDATDEFYVELGLKYQEIQYEIISSFLKMKHKNPDIKHTMFLWLDQFNELTPNSGESAYLQKSGENQLKSLQLKQYYETGANIKIKWTVQGWMFVHMRKWWDNDKIKAYFAGIAADDILILDLIAEKGSMSGPTDEFFKHDHVWCFLHNFGGGHGLSGNLGNIFKTLSNIKISSNMKGIGISMEGIHNNPILYHAVLYHSFQIEHDEIATESYLKQYIASRYGMIIFEMSDNEILKIWQKLAELIYNSANSKWSVTRSLILKSPSKGLVNGASEFVYNAENGVFKVVKDVPNKSKHKPGGFQSTEVDYNVCDLMVIIQDLMKFLVEIIDNSEYKDHILSIDSLANDVAELMRQSGSDFFQQVFLLWKGRDISQDVKKRMEEIMLGIIDDTDVILSDFEYFRLDKWINDARKYGKDEEESNYFELNARNLVTRWGPNGEINDYSSREWNGLMSDYYKQRWRLLFDGGNIRQFESDWQSKTEKITASDNDYKQTGDYQRFYDKIFQISQKYSSLIDCEP